MKLYIKLFLLAEALDILTTLIAVDILGGMELNPLVGQNMGMLVYKVIITLLVAYIFYLLGEKIPMWFRKLVVIVSGFPFVWNSIMIILFVIGVTA